VIGAITVKVSVLLPAAVDTNIQNAERNRPNRLKPRHAQSSEIADVVRTATAETFRQGLAPRTVAEQVVRAIREERFYIFTEGRDSDTWKKLINKRLDEIRKFSNPTLPISDEMTSLFSVALNTIGKCL
jgi:short-subunit dehydrogenase